MSEEGNEQPLKPGNNANDNGDAGGEGMGKSFGGSEGSDAFGQLEQDFEKVLGNLAGDENLDRFREEYQKLHHALKRSHVNEQKLIDKCRELNNEIVSNAAKVQAALRLSRQDQQSIQILKKEIDKAWKMVDAAKGREKQSRETVHRLREEVQKLSTVVDQGAGLNLGQEKTVNDLVRAKNELTKQNESLHLQLAEKTRAQNQLIEQTSGFRKTKADLDENVAKLTEINAKQKRDLTNMNQRMMVMQNKLQQLTTTQAEMIKSSEKSTNIIETLEREQETLRSALSELDAQKQATETKFHHADGKIQDLYIQIEKQKHREAQLLEKYNEMSKEANNRKKEVKRLNFELQRARTQYDKLADAKRKTLNNQKAVEETRDKMLHEMNDIRKEVMTQRKHADLDEKLVKELQNQIKRLTGQLVLSEERTKEAQRILATHEQNKKVLKETMNKQKKEEQKLRQEAYELEKKNDKVLGQSAGWHARYLEATEKIKIMNNKMDDLKKQIEEGEKKLKLQKSLYEQVRADRNFFSKKHVQSQDEITEMKQKFKIMKHQIEQLKEEIQLKDKALVNEHFSYRQLTDEMKVKQRRIMKKNEVLETADKVLANQNEEIKNLRRTLEGAEYQQQRQKKIYDDVVQERDVLAAQLIRRNDELALLYEKIRIQQSTLSKGETQYRERVKDIQMMKLQLQNMRREIAVRNAEVQSNETLKNELYSTQRELLQEKTKVKALSEELENPMNVHRWRQLEGSDPKRWELVQKIKTLQRRLILKTEEAVEKDSLLQEKEKLYVELKSILARQPGPEVAEQLSIYQQTLKEKTRQMKAMAAELNMNQAQVAEHRYEIERLSKELQDNKRRFFEQKRKEQIQKEMQREAQREDPLLDHQQKFHSTQPKVAGGGFNLQPSKHGTSTASPLLN
mmetsp:Transcript_10496/g.14578  ORF Transcript_10496/g.14578 Transcript_10496/m.14578 type:complete len:910 (-) Transcript_10496:315-3044(-)